LQGALRAPEIFLINHMVRTVVGCAARTVEKLVGWVESVEADETQQIKIVYFLRLFLSSRPKGEIQDKTSYRRKPVSRQGS
jgi:hypothetical protein